jgi:hypothetical protein
LSGHNAHGAIFARPRHQNAEKQNPPRRTGCYTGELAFQKSGYGPNPLSRAFFRFAARKWDGKLEASQLAEDSEIQK